MTSRYSSGDTSSEHLQFIIDLVAGDTSGLAEIQQLEARLRQTGESLHGFANNVQQSSQQYIQGMQQYSEATRSAAERFQTFAQAGKTAFEVGPIAGNLSEIVDKVRGVGAPIKDAEESFKAFKSNGLTPVTDALRENSTHFQSNNSHISAWLVNAANFHGALGNIGAGLAAVNPMFAELGKSIPEIGFSLAGLAVQGGNAGLAIANMAAVAFRSLTEMGKAAGEFYNEQVVGAEVAGMTARQYANMSSAADLAGVSTSQLMVITQRLTKVQEDLSHGVENNATKALRGLNVQTEEVGGTLRDTYSVIQDVASAIAHKTTQTEKLAAVEQLFGLRGKEALALLQDLNEVLPLASGLIDQHASTYEGLKEKQREFNVENERMKQNWQDFISSVGPAYTATLKAVNDEMDRMRAPTTGPQGSTAVPGMPGVYQGPIGEGGSTYMMDERGRMWRIDNMTGHRTLMPAAGYPSEDDSANINITPPGRPNESPESIAAQIQHMRNLNNLDLVDHTHDKRTSGSSGFTAAELDRSDTIANQFAGILAQLTQNMPKFNLDLQHMAENIKAWDAANKQYEDRLYSVKAQIQEQSALQAQLTLTGRQYTMMIDDAGKEHKVLTDEYQASQDKIKALQAAEKVLTSERIKNVLIEADAVKMMRDLVEDLAKKAAEAHKAYGPAFAGSVATAAASGGSFVTGYDPVTGTSWGAIVGGSTAPNGTVLGPGGAGAVTSIGGTPTTPSGPSLVGPPKAADGGYVEESGLAIIHKGETIVPAGQGGAITFDLRGAIVSQNHLDWLMDMMVQLQRTGRIQVLQ